LNENEYCLETRASKQDWPSAASLVAAMPHDFPAFPDAFSVAEHAGILE
jgi:hypothetical protein